MTYSQFALAFACLSAHMAMAQVPAGASQPARPTVSESDYLADVPTVISVSRLAQPLEDTPGAVTILDRDFIRMTGARELVDVLRFVPGFQTTTSYEADATTATYHGRNDDFPNRIQVLIDGRSVYSSLLQGSVGVGWQLVALDDIERIEILRGSNSATYGARAFLGVVNIVTRDVHDTQGAAASITQGENGVADAGLRLGWGYNGGTYRISADTAGSDGLQGANGHNRTDRLNLSAHWALEQATELELRAGTVKVNAGRGDPADFAGNAARPWSLESQFVQLDWRRPLDETQDLSISLSHSQNTLRDFFRYQVPGPYFQAPIDAGGQENVDTLTVLHTLRLNPALRVAWGAEYRQEDVMAPQLFDLTPHMPTSFVRLFGGAEWRLSDQWLLNTGALAEQSSSDGNTFSPRLMLNWHMAPGHTLRVGASTAFRPPSPYEKYAHVRYRDVNGQNPTPYFVLNDGTLQREKLFSKELGYYFAPENTAFSGDIRLFQEQITDGIAHSETAPTDTYLNVANDDITGLEWQLKWSPSAATNVLFSQSWTDIHVNSAPSPNTAFRMEHGAPRYASSLALMHHFDQGWNLSVMQQTSDALALMSSSNQRLLYSMKRTDLRLAKEFRLGGNKAELSLTAQNLGDPYEDGDHKFLFKRRTLVTLKIEN